MSRNSFFAELKRRNVIRMAGLYLVAAWLITQVSATLLPGFDAPPWVFRSLVMLLAIGFVPALVFAWVYEITPQGVKRESEIGQHESITPQTGRRMDRAIIVVLVLALVVFAVDRFVVAPRREAKAVADAVEQARATTPANGPVSAAGPGGANASIPEIETDPSIAVLPLADLSQAHDQAYFSDGISEELLNLLSKVPKLRVIAHTSSFSFKGKDASIPDIARALNVAALLEGSVRKAGDTVRITVELIRAKDGAQLWSENYNRRFDDIFAIQDEIAAKVVEQLKIKLLGAAPTAKPVDPKAYPLLLQADALVDRGTPAGRAEGVATYQQVLTIAPREARAWAGLARAYVNQTLFLERATADGVRLIRQAAEKALEIDPGNARALSQLGRLASDFEIDLPAAARYYQRALAAEPGNLAVLTSASNMLANLGRLEESLAVREYRIAHDPANPTAWYNVGNANLSAKRWDNAIEAWRTVDRLSPRVPGVGSGIAEAFLLGKRDAHGALQECAAETDELNRAQCMALALHALGRRDEADAALKTLVGKSGDEQPSNVAAVYAQWADFDAAFQWLDKAAAAHDPGTAAVLAEPLLEPLTADPRWLPFLRRIGYAPEQLAQIELKVTLPDSRGSAKATVP